MIKSRHRRRHQTQIVCPGSFTESEKKTIELPTSISLRKLGGMSRKISILFFKEIIKLANLVASQKEKNTTRLKQCVCRNIVKTSIAPIYFSEQLSNDENRKT